MLLTVDHVTRYRYDAPVRGVVQSHRLTPSRFDGQKVLEWEVTVSGGVAGGAFRDGAGDWVQGWTVAGPVSEIEVRVRGMVETTDLAGVLRGHRETAPPDAYLRDTAATEADAALLALSAVLAGAETPLTGCHALSAAISDAIAYRPGTTHAHTTAAEALAQGEGVCQDHAHALIAAARAAGVPARAGRAGGSGRGPRAGGSRPGGLGRNRAPPPPVPPGPRVAGARGWGGGREGSRSPMRPSRLHPAGIPATRCAGAGASRPGRTSAAGA